MKPGAAVRVFLGAVCLTGFLGAGAVLTGVAPATTDGPAGSDRATLLAPLAANGTAVEGGAAAGGTGAPVVAGERATVLGVSDPVTLDVRFVSGESLRVRALGVQPPPECYAEPSVQFAREALVGQSVTLAGDRSADRFDRALAWVGLPQGDYAVLAAEAGVVTTYPADTPPELMPAVDEAEARAESAGRGVWGPPCVGGGPGTADPDPGD